MALYGNLRVFSIQNFLIGSCIMTICTVPFDNTVPHDSDPSPDRVTPPGTVLILSANDGGLPGMFCGV
jgi:hypothetical protein